MRASLRFGRLIHFRQTSKTAPYHLLVQSTPGLAVTFICARPCGTDHLCRICTWGVLWFSSSVHPGMDGIGCDMAVSPRRPHSHHISVWSTVRKQMASIAFLAFCPNELFSCYP